MLTTQNTRRFTEIETLVASLKGESGILDLLRIKVDTLETPRVDMVFSIRNDTEGDLINAITRRFESLAYPNYHIDLVIPQHDDAIGLRTIEISVLLNDH